MYAIDLAYITSKLFCACGWFRCVLERNTGHSDYTNNTFILFFHHLKYATSFNHLMRPYSTMIFYLYKNICLNKRDMIQTTFNTWKTFVYCMKKINQMREVQDEREAVEMKLLAASWNHTSKCRKWLENLFIYLLSSGQGVTNMRVTLF